MGDMESLLVGSFKRHQDECPNCPYVFHFGGTRVGDFRKSWATACKRAGVPGLLFHDLRRTAGRRLEDAGVPRSVAMGITGHKTECICDTRAFGIRKTYRTRHARCKRTGIPANRDKIC